ncbi:HAMP domain-containing histidine kinase [Streptomyces sp. LP11]|uniref:histidine kinase n=2 Tax=Streptomyces pyxinicus TaxID=2970331 RepID=A0ABT2B0P0_9ACTN|nr:HAMP domain-containing histidine kinase [Streptomyces sp. LP11]
MRMLAVTVLVAACSVAATAWIAVRTTSGAIDKQQGQVLADDTLLLDTLTGYAATHRTWDGVRPVIRDLARKTHRRIALTTQGGTPVSDSAPRPGGLPGRAWAVIDPLSVNRADPIDPRATGPFRLTAAEERTLDAYATRQVGCLREQGVEATVVTTPSGRPEVRTFTGSDDQRATACDGSQLAEPTPTERAALHDLDARVAECLKDTGLNGVQVAPDFTWRLVAAEASPRRQGAERRVPACITQGRRALLKSSVAPPAQLFVGPEGPATQRFHLSGTGIAQVAGAAGLVLALAVGVSVLAATRLARPLRALTDAAQRMRDGGSALVPVTTGDEIGQLTRTFNDMAVHRDRLERQRRVMVGDVAHELRTPLSNIRGWVEAAQDGHVPADEDLLASLHEEAVLLQHVIDDLQDLAAADAGELRTHPEQLDVAELAHQAGSAYRARAEAAGVRITVEASREHWIEGDPVRLRQIVGNLLSNAIRHTPADGSVELRVTAAGDLTVIEVADTGTGIAAEDLPHVFDRFWRAEKSRNRTTGGSGLGLAIVRKLMEAHGGTVSVDSTVGAGTTFTLRLPN